MESAFFFWALAVIILLLDLWALASIWRTTKASGTKLGWTVLIVALPLIGLAIWGVAGPRGVAEPPSSPNHSKG